MPAPGLKIDAAFHPMFMKRGPGRSPIQAVGFLVKAVLEKN